MPRPPPCACWLAGWLVMPQEHATNVDTVVLVTPEVSDDTRRLLSEAGWTVIEAQGPEDLLDSGAFVRLLAFSLTQYQRVLLLEHDTLVLVGGDGRVRVEGVVAGEEEACWDREGGGVGMQEY